ncbi:MAG: TIGR04290 family methyltransferase [Acidobacteriaceae bacterium]
MSPVTSERVWTQSEIRERLANLGQWFHNLDLNGVSTAPDHFLGDYPRVKWESFRAAIPADLSGMTVLDIGCNAGFYSFEMKARGADRVLGIDWDSEYLQQARFAAGVLGVDVEFQKLSIWEIAKLHERFDLVIFMGVFYHLRHPLLALDLIHEHVAKDRMLFQSMQRGSPEAAALQQDYSFAERNIFEDPGYPKMHFVEHAYTGDATNWWLPNRACVEAMLRSSGFRIESHPEAEVYLCRREPLADAPGDHRAVYPAFASNGSGASKG